MMDETTIRVAIRATARISFVLFLAAFLGDALYRLMPAAATRWLKANKDGFTLGLAGSHTVHLAFILTLLAALGREHALKGIMVVALTYSSQSEWVQNVLAAGGCELKTCGKKPQLSAPKVVCDPTRRQFPVPVRLVLRVVGADEYMELSSR